MTDYTPRHTDKPKHIIGSKRNKRRADLEEQRNADAVSLLTKTADDVSAATNPSEWPVVPNHRAVMLKLRVSDLEKAKDYIDSEIEILNREIAVLSKGDSK